MDKALWVVRDRITTKPAIDDLMADTATRGIHDVVLQVRGRADAYYGLPGETETAGGGGKRKPEPRAEALGEMEIDPLGHAVRAGAAVGVRVHAWCNVFFVWSSTDGSLPRSRDHLVHRHPEWLLRPDGVRHLDPSGGSDFEGVYVDPQSAAAREHTLAVFSEIVSRYRVEGFDSDISVSGARG